jgi:hypothetical protein
MNYQLYQNHFMITLFLETLNGNLKPQVETN